MKGIPRKHTIRYALVPSTASWGVDIKETTVEDSSVRRTVRKIATIEKRTIVPPTLRPASLLSPAPIACEIETVLPMERPTIMTVSICIT